MFIRTVPDLVTKDRIEYYSMGLKFRICSSMPRFYLFKDTHPNKEAKVISRMHMADIFIPMQQAAL